MIGDEHVTLADAAILAVELEDAADEMTIDRRMKEHRRCDDQTSRPIENDAAEVTRLADDGGGAGTIEMIMHLLDQARDLVANDLDGDRVHVRVTLPAARPSCDS